MKVNIQIFYISFKCHSQFDLFTESGDEETEEDSCKTKHVRGKKVILNK